MKDEPSITAALLASGRSVRVTPQGKSMLPLLDGKMDSVVVNPLRGSPKRGDLALYREPGGELVLHRITRVYAEKGVCDVRGDGNLGLEKVPIACMYGVAGRICRKGREFSVRHPLYLAYVWGWCHTRRFRKKLLKLYQKYQKRISRKKTGGHFYE